MASHPHTVLGANTAVQPAVNELYTWLTNTYLPTRFPLLFFLRPSSSSSSTQHHHTLHNTATNDTYPLTPPASPIDTLRLLGTALDDDILFFLPSPDDGAGDGYSLQGFVTCFPSGFDTSRKLGLKVRDIHGPVPGYRAKLETGMERFFARLEVGRFARRVNVRLFSPTAPRARAADSGEWWLMERVW